MVEEAFQLSRGDEKAIERVVQDENIHYLHMVFRQIPNQFIAFHWIVLFAEHRIEPIIRSNPIFEV